MSAELAEAIRRSVVGPMWHGSSLGELLGDIDPRIAGARPLEQAHSIWELTLHIAVWTDVARRRVLGERVNPTAAEDWPVPQGTGVAEWTRDRARVHSSHDELADVVRSLPTGRLDATVAGCDYTIRTLLHGVIEHDCYHGGQIALLKKALPQEN